MLTYYIIKQHFTIARVHISHTAPHTHTAPHHNTPHIHIALLTPLHTYRSTYFRTTPPGGTLPSQP